MSRRRNPSEVAIEARKEIHRALGQLSIFKRSRPIALFHLATVLQVEVLMALLSPFEDAPSSNMAHRRAVESSAHAIPTIYKLCDPSPEPATFSREIYAEARELFDFCYKYEQIDFSYKLADKGHLQIFVAQREPRLTFAYTDKSADEAETALRGRELEIAFTGEHLDLDLKLQHELFGALTNSMRARIVRHGNACEYTYGLTEIDLMKKLGKEMVKSFPAEMDSTASVEGVSFNDLRAYWGALLVISNVHFMAHNLASSGNPRDWPLETAVLRASRGSLVESLTKITDLPAQLVETITAWYVYDPAVSNNCPILQPFLALGNDTLCLPFLFVNGNNMERNFFKLLHRHPAMRPFAQSVVDMKEPVALQQLESLFPCPKYKTRKCVEIPRLTDADLVVLDTDLGFLLVVQHKWVTAPETVEESWGNDAKLMEGVRQAVDARDALRANPELAQRALRISDAQQINRVEAVTVCRGFEHTGFVGPTQVPVITEVSFRTFLAKAGDLGILWDFLDKRPDLQKAVGRVKEFSWELDLAGYKFVMPGLMY